MKQGPQIATAVAIGYALGRSRRMKLALMVGGVVLGRRMGNPKELLMKAGDAVSPTGEVGELSSTLRDRLVDAARTAAVTAASSKIDSLGDNLSERAAKIRSPQGDSSEPEDEEQEPTAPKQRSATEDDQDAEPSDKRTRAPRKPSAPRAASTAARKKTAAASSRQSSSRSGGDDG